MGRSRNIKPGFFTNEFLGRLSPHARLLFIGLWTLADREGRLEDRPLRIKGQLFPYEDVDVDSCLNQLCGNVASCMDQACSNVEATLSQDQPNVEAIFIVRYQVEGKRYIQIVNWKKHQTPHHKEVATQIPPYSMLGSSMSQPCVNVDSSMSHDCVKQVAPCPTDSLIPDSLNLIPSSATLSLNEGGEWIPKGVTIPESVLRDESFCKLLRDWARYLSSKAGGINPHTFQSHVVKLVSYGYESSHRAIETSIDRGWLAPDWKSAGAVGLGGSKALASKTLTVEDIFGENSDD